MVVNFLLLSLFLLWFSELASGAGALKDRAEVATAQQPYYLLALRVAVYWVGGIAQ